MPTKLHHYKAFGLTIVSELELPMLSACFESPKVCIRFGNTPEQLNSPLSSGLRYQLTENEFLLNIDNIARYWVQNGNKVTITPLAETTHEESHLYLLGSVFGALLQQRGSLVLHASAINYMGKAILFIGNSGAGKSTLAATFRKHGYKCLTDDLCPVSQSEDIPFATPGYPHSKLWLDSMIKLDLDPDQYPKVRSSLEKRELAWPEHFQAEPLPVGAIIVLAPSAESEIKVRPLKPVEALLMLKQHTYRRLYLNGAKKLDLHFKTISQLVSRVPVVQAIRPKGSFEINALFSKILDYLQQ